jgi:hypothetical protein
MNSRFNILILLLFVCACERAKKHNSSNESGETRTSVISGIDQKQSSEHLMMSKTEAWNEKARNDLRSTLQSIILGEVRLAKRDPQDIVEFCHEVYIEDECPESERSIFLDFAAAELKRAEALLESEKAAWPKETDCDRLDRVEGVLRDRGILFWQVSPCCDTCTVAELGDRIDVLAARYPGFRDKVRGYAFFIDQNLPEELSANTKLSVFLAYGWFSPNDSKVAPDVYRKNALGIAREVCECLRGEGFDVDWNGDFSRKIGISLHWQRRTILE